jgi:hypothetical protein
MIPSRQESRQVRRKQERDQGKAERAQEKLEEQVYYKIQHLLENIFSIDKINEIARKTKFQQRETKLNGFVIASILMMGISNSTESDPIPSLGRLCLTLRKWFNIFVLPQSLLERINRKETALFIKEVTLEVLKYEVNLSMKKWFKKRRLNIDLFNRVLLEDSTVISLPETLSRIFKGCGGAASNAAVKYDFIIDQSNHLIVRVKFCPGKNSDATMSSEIISYLEEEDLVIRDLGYFNLSQLSKINNKKSYFISRLSITAYVYLKKDDENPLNLIQYLKELDIDHKKIDIEVYVGQKERLAVRLVAIKVPPEVIEARKKGIKRVRLKKILQNLYMHGMALQS